jgi:hypothetical protein
MLVVFLAGLAGMLGLLWTHSHRFPPVPKVRGSEWLLNRVQAPWAESPDPAGEPAPSGLLSLRLTRRSPCLGLTLAALALEEHTGARVLGLTRAATPLNPDPELELQADDLLVLDGSPAALLAAQTLLGS